MNLLFKLVIQRCANLKHMSLYVHVEKKTITTKKYMHMTDRPNLCVSIYIVPKNTYYCTPDHVCMSV